jgi:FkbM family methyltransferase
MLELPKRLAFQSLKKMGVHVQRAHKHPTLIDFITNRNIQAVYDIGANIGQFGLALRRRGYSGHIISYEPVRSAFDVLQTITVHDGKWTATHCAIGDHEGEVQINVSRNSQFSSLLNLSNRASSIDPESIVESQENVRVYRLDGLNICSGCLIKIDTQGFERNVLRGAENSIGQAAGVLLELPIVSVYAGSWTFSEAINYMDDLGFVLCQIDPVNHHHSDPMAATEFDCLFRPKREEID